VTPCKRIGIMYSVWHWPAFRAQKLTRDGGNTPLTMEAVLRSRQETLTGTVDGASQYSDILIKRGMVNRAMNFVWHHTPQVFIDCMLEWCHTVYKITCRSPQRWTRRLTHVILLRTLCASWACRVPGGMLAAECTQADLSMLMRRMAFTASTRGAGWGS